MARRRRVQDAPVWVDELPRSGQIRRNEKIAILVAALETGPADMEELMQRTGFSASQFKKAWADIKSEYASANNKIAVYDPVTRVYGLWDRGQAAYNGSLNRVNDALTRLLRIEKGALDAMLAQRVITPRLYRGLVMVRDEYSDLAERMETELARNT